MPPVNWPIDKQGMLQQAGGWGQVFGIELFLPRSAMPSRSLQSIAARTILRLQVASNDQLSMNLQIKKRGSAQPSTLHLPL